MYPAQMSAKKDNALPAQDQASEAVVAFYLTQETDLPAIFQGKHQIVSIGITGRPVETPALRVTFSHDSSVEEPVGLLGFGSGHKCHVRLPANIVHPVHCKVFAQLNSGPQVWLVEDSSPQGTHIQYDDNSGEKQSKFVHGRCHAAQGESLLAIGPYRFRIRPPISVTEIRQREDWFKHNKPIPVTRSMLDRQAGHLQWEWLKMECVGQGGFGKVFKYMEANTALSIAIKHVETEDEEQKKMALKEIDIMKTLRHVSLCHRLMKLADLSKPFLIDMLFDDSDNKPLPEIAIAMPLCLGDLRSRLPLPDMPTTERFMFQMAEGLRFMHSSLFLHRDLKPENILVVSPVDIRIADYGWATSLRNTDSLSGRCGTPGYCAPETLRSNETHTAAIDIYSLGAMFYEMLDLDKVKRGWERRIFHGQRQWFNTTFENASNSPPRLFAGLIQSMLATNPKRRCSLDECIEVVMAQKHDWTGQAALMPTVTATHLVEGSSDTQRRAKATRLQQIPFGKARAKAKMPKPKPFAPAKVPKNLQIPQQGPVIMDWRPFRRQEPLTPAPQAVPMQQPYRKPAHVEGVNFNAGLPSYEEATHQNPFAAIAPRGGRNEESPRLKPTVTDKNLELRTKKSPIKQAPPPVAQQKPNRRSQEAEASTAVRAAPRLPSIRGPRPRNSHRPLRPFRDHAISIHRAHDAGVHRRREPADRQAARAIRAAKLKRGVCEVAKGYWDMCNGYWNLYSALIGFAREELCLGGGRIYKMMLKDDPTADKQPVARMQRHSLCVTGSGSGSRQRTVRFLTDEEVLDSQLM